MLKIISSQELKPTKWSGGATTQLFIFPPTADYQKMNFDFRISTATVDVESSVFTPLPGVQRTLMVLNGCLQLVHQGHHTATIQPFESDSFSGDWQTQSVGLAEDFNLMVRHPDLKGSIRHIRLAESEVVNLSCLRHGFLWIYRGWINLKEDTRLSQRDSLYFDSSERIEIVGGGLSDLIFTEIA